MQNGQLFLNDVAVPKERIADFTIRVSPNTQCRSIEFQDVDGDGHAICRYPQYRETLPNGKSYNVLDLYDSEADNTDPVVVPEGHMFLMGDNRDNSLDSRFAAVEGGGIGIVPQENLIGRAQVSVFSVDGSANFNPRHLVYRAALEPHRGRLLNEPDTEAFLNSLFAEKRTRGKLYVRALTHGSTGRTEDYQRLEFLGDRVAGAGGGRMAVPAFRKRGRGATIEPPQPAGFGSDPARK